MQGEIASLREQVSELTMALRNIEEKYDIEIMVKTKSTRKRMVIGSSFLAIDDIGASRIRRIKAMPKKEWLLAKVQAVIRGHQVRLRYRMYRKQQISVVRL